MERPLYAVLVSLVDTISHYEKDCNAEAVSEREAALAALSKQYLPAGFGFGEGPKVLLNESTAGKLVLSADFKHRVGKVYSGVVTEHKVIVTPSRKYGFMCEVTGDDYRFIKGHIIEAFNRALERLVTV